MKRYKKPTTKAIRLAGEELLQDVFSNGTDAEQLSKRQNRIIIDDEEDF